jgi:site-specific DNA recombinase
MKTTKSAVILARVSSREQETGFSLDAQEKLAKDQANKLDLKVEKIYKISESASGKQVRKLYNEMFSYVTKNNISVVLCEKIDRLTRNPKDAVTVQEWITGGDERQVHFIKENFILSKNTRAHENLVWDMKVAIARFYTNNLSEEVRKGLNEKFEQGLYPGSTPIGYNQIGEKGARVFVQDPKIAPFITQMFELYASGNYSILSLASKLYKEGFRTKKGKKIVKTGIHRLLSNRFYYGENEWMGKIKKGQHEPLITKELYDLVQQKLKRGTSAPQYKKHLSTFKGKVICKECGGMINWSLQKGRWYGECNHYRPCKQKGTLRQDRLEEQLFPLLEKAVPKNERVIELLELALKESHKDEITFNSRRREDLNLIVRKADERMEKAYRDKLDGVMPLDLCQKMIEGAKIEKDEALSALESLSNSRQAYYEAGISIHELASKAKEIYQSEKASVEDRRMLMSYAFTNFSIEAGKITAEYTLAFQFLAEWMPKLNSNYQLQNSLIKQEDYRDLVSSCSDLRRRTDSNRRCPLRGTPL